MTDRSAIIQSYGWAIPNRIGPGISYVIITPALSTNKPPGKSPDPSMICVPTIPPGIHPYNLLSLFIKLPADDSRMMIFHKILGNLAFILPDLMG